MDTNILQGTCKKHQQEQPPIYITVGELRDKL
jgi:hypothetical protein